MLIAFFTSLSVTEGAPKAHVAQIATVDRDRIICSLFLFVVQVHKFWHRKLMEHSLNIRDCYC